MRKDARLRRERLIQAAVELYATDGFDVSLEKVADRAQVGRGTLYRNFPDRAALATAVAEARLAELAAYIEGLGDRKDAFFLAIRALAILVCATSGFEKITSLQHQACDESNLFRKGVEKLLAEPLARAKAAKLVRQEVALSDVHMVALMAAGGGLDDPEREANIGRALRLLFLGLSPAGAVARELAKATAPQDCPRAAVPANG